jgi:hypothetical protein
MIRKETRDKIGAQALIEMSFARTHKQGKVKNWKKNETAYYGAKEAIDTGRSNINILNAKTYEFVTTFLSKIDAPLTFKYTKRKDSQLKRVARLNALKEYDANRGIWNIKDIAGKVQVLIYGRAIYQYAASSDKGYNSNLDPVDVYDFLVDPSVGGIDMEKAQYMGRYGVVKNSKELREGGYIKTSVDAMLRGTGNALDETQEKTNARHRTTAQGVRDANKEVGNKDRFVFWEWYTTYEGERYYLLMTDNGVILRCELLKDIFASDLWPFWSWAAIIDLTEFWTPAYLDFVREIFMGQHVSINQMVDNAEQINKPMKYVNVGAIDNLSELKYRRDGTARFKDGTDMSKAVFIPPTPSIQTPLEVYNILEVIQEKASGVNSNAKGSSEEEKVGIYEGNQAATADRFGLVNKSYSFGYERFAKLYEHGVREHLTKRVAVDILGPEGMSVEEVSRRDIFRKSDTFGVQVDSSDAELALSQRDIKNKLTFITQNKGNPIVNQQKLTEMEAQIVGFTEDEVRQLMDVSEFGDATLMSEAERDIEAILDGEDVKPNRMATAAYKQRFVDYMLDNEEDIRPDQAQRLFAYMDSLEDVILENMQRKANEVVNKETLTGTMQPEMTDAAAPEDLINNPTENVV